MSLISLDGGEYAACLYADIMLPDIMRFNLADAPSLNVSKACAHVSPDDFKSSMDLHGFKSISIDAQ